MGKHLIAAPPGEVLVPEYLVLEVLEPLEQNNGPLTPLLRKIYFVDLAWCLEEPLCWNLRGWAPYKGTSLKSNCLLKESYSGICLGPYGGTRGGGVHLIAAPPGEVVVPVDLVLEVLEPLQQKNGALTPWLRKETPREVNNFV